MRRSRVLNIALATLTVFAGIGGYVALASTSGTAATTERVVTAATGIVLSSVSATGNVQAPTSLNVDFAKAGTVTDIAVATGQKVVAGDVLAHVDSAAQQDAVMVARAQLASAQASMSTLRSGQTDAQRAQTAAQELQSTLSVSAAEKALSRAQAAAITNADQYDRDIAAAATKLDTANTQEQRNEVKANEAIDTANAARVTAENALAQARDDLQSAIDNLTKLQSNYDAHAPAGETSSERVSRYKYDKSTCDAYGDGITYTSDGVYCKRVADLLAFAITEQGAEGSVANAVSANDAAQRAADSAKEAKLTGIFNDDLVIAAASDAADAAQRAKTAGLVKDQQAIDDANDALAKAKASNAATLAGDAVSSAGPTSSALAQAAVSVAQAKSSYDAALKDLNATTLVAPVDGTIAAINGKVGQTSTVASGSSSSTAAFIVLTDLHQFEVAVPFTETDATKVSVGQAVTITFDSLPNVTLTGKVLSISVTSTVTNNVVSYAGLVSVVGDTTKVRPGMTATVDVALDKREGVVTLPTSAVSGTGSTAVVTVRRAGAPDQQRSIAIGLRGDNAIEVLSGLKAGEKVVTTIASGASNGGLGNRAGGFGGPAGGGGVVRVGRGGGG